MKNSEAPGATNRNNPKRAARIPSTKISHQGRVSPLLPADIPTLHLPRRLSTPSLHYGHRALTPASIYPNSASSCPYSPKCLEGRCSRKLARRDPETTLVDDAKGSA